MLGSLWQKDSPGQVEPAARSQVELKGCCRYKMRYHQDGGKESLGASGTVGLLICRYTRYESRFVDMQIYKEGMRAVFSQTVKARIK